MVISWKGFCPFLLFMLGFAGIFWLIYSLSNTYTMEDKILYSGKVWLYQNMLNYLITPKGDVFKFAEGVNTIGCKVVFVGKIKPPTKFAKMTPHWITIFQSGYSEC